MSIEYLSSLSVIELMKLYNKIGWILFMKTALPIIVTLSAIYGILWLKDKRMC